MPLNILDMKFSSLYRQIVESNGLSAIITEDKERLLDRMPHIDDAQRAEMKQFFRTHSELEKRFDWNRPETITYDSFRKLADEYTPTDPATVPEFSDPQDEGGGIVSYLVQDDRAGMMAVRRVVDTHWGRDASPWCLITREGEGVNRWNDPSDDPMKGAFWYWNQYDASDKRIAFRNGRLIAFRASRSIDSAFEQKDTDEGYDMLERRMPGRMRKEYEEALENGEERDIFYWMLDEYPDIYDTINVVDEWWDRKDRPHPDLEWAKGAAR